MQGSPTTYERDPLVYAHAVTGASTPEAGRLPRTVMADDANPRPRPRPSQMRKPTTIDFANQLIAFATRYNSAAQPLLWRFNRDGVRSLLTWIGADPRELTEVTTSSDGGDRCSVPSLRELFARLVQFRCVPPGRWVRVASYISEQLAVKSYGT
jgi:hypothetical protein